MKRKTRTRFAPSPTGTPESIHLGFIIRALWNYAYSKKYKGQFILRIEDTDQKRSRKDTEEEIYKILKKFGINWDEGPDIGGSHAPYRQSERLSKYQEAAKKLVESGHAYYDFDAVKREKEEIKESYESEEGVKALKIKPAARSADPKESSKRVSEGEPYVIRVKMPENRKFKYKDWILKKEIEFDSSEVSDMILLKSDGFPTYHLAVVVDDIEMEISHVFRGQEWISSTPIHLFLYEAFGNEIPEIGHFSVILDPRTNKKFSKRDASAYFGVKTWLDKGYLPEAILNYLMLLGWAPKDNRELFTLEEFCEAFDQDGVQKANPVFNEKKLDWFNGHYIREKSDSELFELLKPFLPKNADEKKVKEIIPLVKDRIKNLSEFESLAGYIFKKSDEIKPIKITSNYNNHISAATIALKNINTDSWNTATINNVLGTVVEKNNFKTGDFYMDLRGTIAGSKFTPPLNETLVTIGQAGTISRLERGSEEK